MKKNLWKIVTIALAVAFAATFIVAVALGPCTHMLDCDGSQQHMKCYWAYRAVAVLSVTGAANSLIAIMANTKESRKLAMASILLQLMAAIVLFSSFGIGTCGNAEMTCNVHGIGIIVLHTIIIILCLVGVFKGDPQEAEKPKMSL